MNVKGIEQYLEDRNQNIRERYKEVRKTKKTNKAALDEVATESNLSYHSAYSIVFRKNNSCAKS